MCSSELNKSLMLSLGGLFVFVYFVYFIFFPLLAIIDSYVSLDLSVDYFVAAIYDKHRLSFLTYKSFYIIIIGLCSFVAGYVLLNNNWRYSFLRNEWSFRNVLIASAVFFLGGIFSKIVGVLKGDHQHFHFSGSVVDSNLVVYFSSINILQIISLALLGIGFILSVRRGEGGWKKIFFVLFVSTFVAFLLLSYLFGSKTLTISIILIFFVVFSVLIVSYKKQVYLVLLMSLLLFSSFVLKGYIENSSKQGSIERAVQGAGELLVGRVNQSHIVTEIVSRNSEKELFYPYLELLGPILGDEARKQFVKQGNIFGHEYGFLSETDYNTGVGKTMLGGLYISFGFLGVLFGMFFVGGRYSWNCVEFSCWFSLLLRWSSILSCPY